MTAGGGDPAAKSLAKPIVVLENGGNFAPVVTGARLCEITETS
jgi:hypothetical protein